MKPAKLFVIAVTLFGMLVLSVNAWATAEVHPRVTVGEEYNDNIHLDYTDEEDDWITTVQPGVSLFYNNRSLDATIDYSLRFRFYKNNSDENQDKFKDVQRANASLLFFPGRPFTLHLSENISSVTLDERKNSAEYNEVENRSVLYHSTVAPEYNWQLTKTFSLVFGYVYDRNDYVGSRGNDTESHEGHFSLVKQISAITEVFARFSYLDHRSDDTDDEFKQQTYTLGINQELGSRISGSLEGGYTTVDQKTDSTVDNGHWLVDLSYHLSKPVTLTLDYSQSYEVTPEDGITESQQASLGAHYVRESLTASTSLFWTQSKYLRDNREDQGSGLRFDLSKPLARNLTANLNGEYRHNEYEDPDEKAELYTLGSSLDYTYHRFLISLGYIYRKNDSDVGTEEYTNNVVTLDGTVHF